MGRIGFLGAGALIRREGSNRVQGTATAASVWTTGVVGASVGLGQISTAVILVVLNYLVLRIGAWQKPDEG